MPDSTDMKEHHHEHNGCCGHGHGHDHAECPAGPEVHGDPATQSLANALRVTFRLLTVVMVLVIVAFLMTGITCIQPQQIGIVKTFGKVTHVSGQGLVYTWPFPVGEIEIVSVNEQKMTVDDFWMYVATEDKLPGKNPREYRTFSEGLRPGWDGALLTGDRNLLHAMMIVTYAVLDSQAVKTSVCDNYISDDPLTGAKRTVDPLQEVLRSAINQSAIEVAATRTADGIRMDLSAFGAAVVAAAQKHLNGLIHGPRAGETAVRINSVQVTAEWPLKALPAYDAAQRAVSEAQTARFEAIRQANDTLSGAMGAGYPKLVGEPWNPAVTGTAGEPYNLIGQYVKAKDASDARQATAQLEKIDALLTSNATGGKAASIVEDARKFRTSIEQQVRARSRRFEELLPQYQASPQLTLERLWAETRDAILSSATVEKFYLTFGGEKTVLQINRDPKVVKEIEKTLLQQDKDKEKK